LRIEESYGIGNTQDSLTHHFFPCHKSGRRGVYINEFDMLNKNRSSPDDPAMDSEGARVTTFADNRLLEGIGRGDTAAFDALFRRHYDRVYGLLFRLVGNRVEAEDLTQEVFLKLYRQPLRGSREHNVGAWLYRVATNMGYNHIRGRRRFWQRNVALVPEEKSRQDDPAERAAERETKAAVRAALARLPERQVQLLLLRQMDLSYAELAAACEVAPGSVGTLLARAADAFRKAYRKENEEIR
jgi:RNA polymerase sigma-70 factor, ECF subfamily